MASIRSMVRRLLGKRQPLPQPTTKPGVPGGLVIPSSYIPQAQPRELTEQECYAQIRDPKAQKVVQYTPAIIAKVIGQLRELGFDVRDIEVDAEAYQRYFAKAGYPTRFPHYYSFNLPEKSLEHFMAAKLLGLQPEPWTPQDSLAWLIMMAWDLGGNWSNELMFAHLATKLGPEKAAALMPAYTADGPLILPGGSASNPLSSPRKGEAFATTSTVLANAAANASPLLAINRTLRNELDLGGNGIRGLAFIPVLGAYLLIGGPPSRESGRFDLWCWSGEPGAVARRATVPGLSSFAKAEGVCPAVIGGVPRIVLVSDDGKKDAKRSASFLLLDPAQLRIDA